LISRAARAFRLHGPAGVARIAAYRVRRLVVVDETHIWLALELGRKRPRRELAEGFVLRRASEADLGAVERLPDVGSAAALRRELARGHDLWLVAAGGRVAFACWVHHEEAPVFAARGRVLRLPPGVCCLEDSATSPEFRGRGVAPAAWSSIATSVEAAGYTVMITKIESDNEPSARALEKAGFAAIARMHFVRRWPHDHVTLSEIQGSVGRELAERLAR
jgi:GNAT superfamily N-acetyltransferase